MTEAIFGLVGVVVGGVLNGGITWLVERRNQRDQVRVAARLVDGEIRIAAAACNVAVDSKSWHGFARVVSSKHWGKYQATLSGAMTDGEWDVVRDYHTHLLQILKPDWGMASFEEAIDSGEMESLKYVADLNERASTVLQSYAQRTKLIDRTRKQGS